MTSQDEFFFGKTLFHPETTYFTHTKKFFSDKVQIPKWAPFAPNGTANQIAGNPGTTVVNIGHLTTWPENPGYRTQAWDNAFGTSVRKSDRTHGHENPIYRVYILK